ncbi:MAG TPA: hypothetical protein P5184_01915, partial [Bacteroidales bacterium]|nr:hypothetical protein [Bacteroidales bacterium]
MGEAEQDRIETQEYLVNMGPQHPSTHGVLRLLLKLEGFDNPESVRELVGKDVFTAVKDLPSLSEGRYYHHQL